MVGQMAASTAVLLVDYSVAKTDDQMVGLTAFERVVMKASLLAAWMAASMVGRLVSMRVDAMVVPWAA